MSDIKYSSEIQKFQAAFLSAQKEFVNPRMDKLNPFHKNRYASLAAVRDAVLPVLLKHDITVMQLLTNNDKGDMTCVTELMHVTGEFKSCALSIPADRMTGQGYASVATYAKRIALQAACCVVGDDDDDGEAGEKRGKKKGIPANAEGVEHWENAGEEEKKFLTDIIIQLMDFFKEGRYEDAARFFYKGANIDLEEQLAVWSQLNSTDRNKMKKFKQER